MNKNRLKALLYKQESKQVILSSSIDSIDIIKQNNSSLNKKLSLDVISSSNTIIEGNQNENTLDSKLNLLVDSSSNTIVDVSDIFLNNNVDNTDIISENEFENILDNELNISNSVSEVFSNENNLVSEVFSNKNNTIATILSNQYNFKNEEIDDLLKLNICNKKFYDEYNTTIEEFNYLVTELTKIYGTIKGCLFRNFSTCLNIEQKQLREDSVNYILMKWNQFKDFVIRLDSLELYNSSDDYKLSMLKDDSRGNYWSVFALCELYQINAIIITEEILQFNPIKINTGSSKTILIKC
jgi:hypothetical protein